MYEEVKLELSKKADREEVKWAIDHNQELLDKDKEAE